MLPWVTMTLVGSFNLLHFTSATNSVMLVPWAMVIADLGLRATGFAGAHLTGLSRLAGIIVVLTALVDGVLPLFPRTGTCKLAMMMFVQWIGRDEDGRRFYGLYGSTKSMARDIVQSTPFRS